MLDKKLSRRTLLQMVGMGTAAVALAACQPKVVEVEKVVKETVEVEKVVEKEVEKVVKETVVVTEEKVVKEVADQVEVRFLEDPSPEVLKAAMPLVDAFQDQTGIRLRYEPLPGGTEKLLAALAAGTAPDVFGNWGNGMRNLIEKGQCLNLDSLVSRDFAEDEMGDFVQSQIDAATFDGSLFALPQYCGIWAGFYNKRIFDETGLPYPDKNDWTYDRYLDYCIKTTKRDANGRPLQLGVDEWFGFEFTIATNIWTWGGEVHDPADNRICKLGEEKAMAAMQWLADFRWKWKVAGTDSENAAINNAGGGNGLFGSDLVAMKTEGSWGTKGFIEAAADRFDWGVMPHHSGPDGGRTTFSTTDTWMVNAKTPAPDAAWEWLKYITGPDWQRMRIAANGLQPCRRSLAQEWVDWATAYAKEKNPNADQDFGIFVEGFDYCRPMVWFSNHTDAMEILRPAIDQVYKVGDVQVADVIPDACAKVTELLTKA